MHQPIHSRHPELVSGPIFRFAQSKRRQAQPHRQVSPMRVSLVDQIDLPRAVPVLELLFASDSALHVAEHLEMNEAVDMVFGGMPGKCIVAMLPQPAEKVGRYADVERAVELARKDVDARVAFFAHGAERGAKWALKQVQGDEVCLILDVSLRADLVSACNVSQSARRRVAACWCAGWG